jgi:hypothetical protein
VVLKRLKKQKPVKIVSLKNLILLVSVEKKKAAKH